MSYWIEFHAAKVKRLQKFSDFRKDLQFSVNEALGFLGSFWCEVIELAESGDISGWSPEYVCERVGSSLSPERVWNALVKHRWVDKTAAGRFLVHDWLDYAGIYLRNKYASRNREKLVEIWALHGRVYARQEDANNPATANQFASNRKPIAPKGVGRGKGSGSSAKAGKREEGERKGGPEENHRGVFDAARQAYPGTTRGLDVEWANFTHKHPNYEEILPLLLPAIHRGIEYRAAAAAANAFAPTWPHYQTWINQSRWTEKHGEIRPGPSGFNPPPATRDQLELTMDQALSGLERTP